MQTTRKQCVALFKHLKFHNASEWPKDKMLDSISRLPVLVDENTKAGKHSKLLESLIHAVETGDTIEISNTAPKKGSTTMAKKTPPSRPAKKTAKKKAASGRPAKSAKKPAKKKATKKAAPKATAKKKSGPGVLDTIAAVLKKASKTKPITKAQILTQLEKAFPERDPEHMKKTIATQVPARIGSKGITVEKTKNKSDEIAFYAK